MHDAKFSGISGHPSRVGDVLPSPPRPAVHATGLNASRRHPGADGQGRGERHRSSRRRVVRSPRSRVSSRWTPSAGQRRRPRVGADVIAASGRAQGGRGVRAGPHRKAGRRRHVWYVLNVAGRAPRQSHPVGRGPRLGWLLQLTRREALRGAGALARCQAREEATIVATLTLAAGARLAILARRQRLPEVPRAQRSHPSHVVALVILVGGALNNGVVFDIDYVAGTATAVSLLWVAAVIAALVFVVGLIAASWRGRPCSASGASSRPSCSPPTSACARRGARSGPRRTPESAVVDRRPPRRSAAAVTGGRRAATVVDGRRDAGGDSRMTARDAGDGRRPTGAGSAGRPRSTRPRGSGPRAGRTPQAARSPPAPRAGPRRDATAAKPLRRRRADGRGDRPDRRWRRRARRRPAPAASRRPAADAAAADAAGAGRAPTGPPPRRSPRRRYTGGVMHS